MLQNYENTNSKKNNSNVGITIPINALINGEVVFKVFYESDNEQIRSGSGYVKGVKVLTGEINESSVFITSGLKEGDLYVVSGGHLLTDGQEVRFAY